MVFVVRFSENVDDMDTESLIQMVKARHAQSQSDADKQIQERLGQLSSKLSWVVEYPKDQQKQQQQQQMQMLAMSGQKHMYPAAGMMPGMADDDDEEYPDDDEEEDYADEDFDEEELDEQELAALAYMRKMGEKGLPAGLPGSGHYEGVIGEEEYGEDFDQEMEAFDVQHRVFNPAEKVQNFGVGADRPQSESVFAGYQRSASPSLENFLMIGSNMAKCLVCNKIVRKTEVKQHNASHEEEEDHGEEEEEEEGEDGGVGNYEEPEEGDVGLHDMEGEYPDNAEEEYHDEEDLGGEVMAESLDMAEFTAEPLNAENFVAEKITDDLNESKKSEKSTVCDICEKNFKSYHNMLRHRKIHTDAKQFICPVCKKDFRLQNYLSKHLKKVHPEYEQQVKDGDGGSGAPDGGAEDSQPVEEGDKSQQAT